MATPLGNVWSGSRLRAVMSLRKSAYWKMNSLSFVPPTTQLWFTFTELKSLVLSPQLLGGRFDAAP